LDIKDFCKIFGIILVMLAYTAFAQAAIYNFNCSNTFNCSVPGQCTNGTISGEAFAWEWANYNFNSTEIGLNYCTATVETTGYGAPNQAQTSEEVEVYINGTFIGRTVDNYANTCSTRCGENIFCGLDSQSFLEYVDLTAENELQLYIDDSVSIVRITLNCQLITPYYDVCENNLAPIIQDIPNRTISYTESTRYDLWDYVNDYDSYDYLSDLNIVYSRQGNSVSCTFDGRNLNCDAVHPGTSTITISATDSCDATTEKQFTITVTNAPPVLSLTNQQIGCTQNLEKFINLHNKVWDEDKTTLDFNIISQSNISDINCYLKDDHYITCETNTCEQTSSTLTITATDEFGLVDTKSMTLSIINQPPVWFKKINDVCINENTSNIYDLRNYVSDPESGTNLTFTLEQSNPSILNCFINDNYYVSCNGITNLHGKNTLTITATDNFGLNASTTVNVSANCFENVTFSSDNTDICMENFTTYSKQIELRNISNEERCYDFYTEFDIEGVEARVTPKTMCVQPNETRWLTLNINAYNSQIDDYELTLYGKKCTSPSVCTSEIDLEMKFNLGIGTCDNFDGFFVEEFDRTVCQGEKWSVPVMVRNYSNETKTISLKADNGYLLPYFEEECVTVPSGSKKKVNLIVNAKTAPLGYYYIQLDGISENYQISKLLELEVIDCSNIHPRTFILEVPNTCFEVNKGERLDSYFTIKRTRDTCSDPRDPVNVYFKTQGFRTELSYNSKEIECFAEESIEYSAFINENEKAGTHFLKVTATDGQFEETKEVCINVLGKGKSQFLLKTSPQDIESCSTGIFILEIRNTGDFDEDFSLSASGVPNGVTINFSETDFSVPKGQSKIIYAAVSTNVYAALGESKIKITLEGPETHTTELKFNITEQSVNQNIEFLSYTSQVTTKQNSKTEYELILRNNTNTDLTNISLRIEGSPEDVNFEEIIIPEIKAGQTKTIVGEVSVGNTTGFYTASYVVSKGNISNKQDFTIYIEQNSFAGAQNSSGTGFLAGTSGFTGLFGLSGEGTIGLIEWVALALFLILLLLGIILIVTDLSKPVTYEKWVVGEFDE